MNDNLTQFIDDLDTGLPLQPDLDSIRAAGRSHRHRRTAAKMGLGSLAALALATPLVLGLGGSGADRVIAPATDGTDAPASLTGPDFGPTMRATVEAAVAGTTWQGERLVDDFDCGPRVCNPTVHSPPRWETFVEWSLQWELASGATLTTTAQRMSPLTAADGPVDYCASDYAPSVRSCKTRTVGDRIVVIHDGIQYGQDDTHWNRDVEVYTADGERGMDSHVDVAQFAVGDNWAQARSRMVSVEDAVALALDEELVLPEPLNYPAEDPDVGAAG